ncbi:MAG: deoxyribose-phosphate aldolase [Phycisphaerae bacterium]
MNAADLAAVIDHTILKPEADLPAVEQVCDEAVAYKFASVCLQPRFVKAAAGRLAGRGVVCTVVGFPHGANKPTLKAIEATAAVKDGATEIDVVAHLPYLIAGDVDAAKLELMEVVRGARAVRSDVVIKVIVESAALVQLSQLGQERVIEAACRAVRESGCDFIKTSTGFHPAGGATVEAVRLMKEHAGGLRVKASGGIRDLATAEQMLAAGADRLGMSAGVAVMKQLAG